MNLVNRIIYEKKAHEMSAEITQQSNTLKWSTNRLAESVGAFLLGGIFIGATIGAALKKIAVAILTNKNALKKALTVILVILLVILFGWYQCWHSRALAEDWSTIDGWRTGKNLKSWRITQKSWERDEKKEIHRRSDLTIKGYHGAVPSGQGIG